MIKFPYLFQSDVESKSKDILKLGLLQADMSPQKAHTGILEQPKWLTFPHKIFQDLFNAFYIESRGEVSTMHFLRLVYSLINCLARNSTQDYSPVSLHCCQHQLTKYFTSHFSLSFAYENVSTIISICLRRDIY